MARTAQWYGLALSMCLAAGGCNSIIDAGAPTVVVDQGDGDPPRGDGGGGGGGGGTGGPICGDGQQDDGEQCDDGNDDPNDGCDACVRSCGVKPEFLDVDSGHCYRISEDDLQPWDQANQKCAEWGGALVSLESIDELVLVQTRVSVDTWTGGRSTAPGADTFEWLSGAPAMFDPAPGGAGDCIKLGGDLLEFVRGDCAEPLHFVCEREDAGP